MNKKEPSVFLVIPTIRNLDFLKNWNKANELESIHVIVVVDSQETSISVPKIRCRSITLYNHTDIENEFKKDSWIFPWKSASIRSYGFYKAYKRGADIIVTLDDDCFPHSPNFFEKHVQNLKIKLPTDWTPTYPFRDIMYTRGFPYFIREKVEVAVSHGLWSEIPDFDGMTQLNKGSINISTLPDILHIIPPGLFFPMSSMNLAFTRKAAPLMYQLLMGQTKEGTKWRYDRFDDIWSGIIAKKILDHLQMGTVSGSPFVRHKRASNVLTNIEKEATGIAQNESFWKFIKGIELKSNTIIESYREVATQMRSLQTDYFKKLSEAMLTWSGYFS